MNQFGKFSAGEIKLVLFGTNFKVVCSEVCPETINKYSSSQLVGNLTTKMTQTFIEIKLNFSQIWHGATS